ncbi:T9SS type B sorting domain-containing protein [Pontibacter sp. H249]|uniref:T9SS type B sorting domain-containing protein n=1 Tax=Pontibacter sp. H249 TaxID=3133420 RepID=UPI0030C65896
MLKSTLYIVLLLLTFTSYAQNGCFKAYAPSGTEITTLCVNQEVTFQDCGNVVPDDQEYYVFDYKSGTAIPQVTAPIKKHTYTKPGKYRVLQIANYGGATRTDTVSQVFEVKDTPAPAFTVTACANNAVRVNITDTNYDSYTINYGDGGTPFQQTQSGTAPNYTYPTSGTYTVTVTGRYTGGTCNGSSAKQVSTLPPFVLPRLQNLAVAQQGVSGEIQFDIQNLQPGYLYIVERWQNSAGNFVKIDTIRNISQTNITHTVRNVNTTEAVQYLIRIADQCNSITAASSSNTVSSIALAITSGNEQAVLNWQYIPGANQFEVYRNNTLITTLQAGTNTYTDNGLSCGQTYTYFIKGISADGGTSVSAPQAVQVTSSTVPAAPYLLASFNLNNEVELSITLPQDKIAQQIDIQKSINGAAYQRLATVQQPQYTDKLPNMTEVCYQVTFTDPCINTSPMSNTACPMLLKAERQSDGSVLLRWSSYTGFPNGIKQYVVELLDESGNTINSFVAQGTSYTDATLSNQQQVLRYRVRASSNTGTEVSFSNLESIKQELQLYIPSAFTPNGDGLNDELEIKGRFIQSYTLKVYNSLGNVVYEGTDGAANWNGTYQGKLLPAGAYAYEITVKTNFGETKRRTGTVTLLR